MFECLICICEEVNKDLLTVTIWMQLTDSSSYFTCSIFRVSFNLVSFSALRLSSSNLCCLAFSACRFSISSLLFCCPLGVLWLNVLSKPPNSRWPRFFSSCTLLFRRSVLWPFNFSSDSTLAGKSCLIESKDGGEARRVWGDSALLALESLGRLDAMSAEAEDCRRFVRGDLEWSGSGRITADEMRLVGFSEKYGASQDESLTP